MLCYVWVVFSLHSFNEHSSSVATSNLQRTDHLGTRFNQDKRFVLVLKCGFNLEFPAFDSHHHSMIIFSPSPSLGQKMKIKFWCIYHFFLKKGILELILDGILWFSGSDIRLCKGKAYCVRQLIQIQIINV